MATTVTGALGADTITGLVGADTLAGGLGNDTYIVKSLLNVINETLNGGIDSIQTNVLNSLNTYSLDRLPYVENLAYTGTLAAQLKGNASDNIIKANSATATNDTLYGANGNDSLYGYGGNDLLQGGNGDDVMDGGSGVDTLIGGKGNDTYLNVHQSDIIIEITDSGLDTISTNATGGRYLDLRNSQVKYFENLTYNDTIAGTLNGNNASNIITSTSSTGADKLYGWAGNDALNGGGGNDSLYGGEGDDDLNGGLGTDSLEGGNGNDLYFVNVSTDVVKELADGGVDTLIGVQTSIATTAYATTIENLIYTGTTGTAITGNTLDNIIGGGSGNDTITASTGNDTLIGGSGQDSILGGAGNDVLYGGTVSNLQSRYFLNPYYENSRSPDAVNDQVVDILVGGAGSDTYFIDNFDDTITELDTDTGIDVINATIDLSLADYSNIEGLVLDDGFSDANAWFAEGNASDNVIIGNNSENYIYGGAGNDILTGDMDGSGIYSNTSSYPYYGYTSITDVIDGGDGNDVLLALAQANTSSYWDYVSQSYIYSVSSYSSHTDNVLMGGAGNDFYLIQNDKTAIYDSLGTDTVYLMTSATLDAAEGVERIVLAGGSSADDAIAIAALNKVNLVERNSSGTITSVTSNLALNATGNALANTMIGNSNNNLLNGQAGNDSLTGGAGNDTLVGGAGIDTLVGGLGDDTYEVDTSDVVTEALNGGTDYVRSATLTTYAAYANIEGLEYTGTTGVLLQNGTTNTTLDRFTGGTGNDTINGWGGDDVLSGSAGNDSLTGGDGNDSLTGGLGADTLMGGAGNDTMVGFGDSSSTTIDLKNTLYGGAGLDLMTGGNGADLIYGEADNDVLYGGLGADTMDGGLGSDQLYAGAYYSYDNSDTAANVLTGAAGNDSLYGSAGNDTLSGGTEDDDLTGNGGNDSLSGNDGADELSAGDGNDTLSGGLGNDTLYGAAGDDSLTGDDGNDWLTGSDGNDTLNGGAGNDSLTGDAGDDILYAGLATTTVVTNYQGSGDTLIGDYAYNYGWLTGKDLFRFEATAAFASQSVPDGGSYVDGVWVPTTKEIFNTGHFINDFTVSEDKIEFAKAMVGDADLLLEGVTTKTTAGGTFAQTAEMVIVSADVTTDFSSSYGGYWYPINATEVVAAIGTATAAFAIGDKRLFVVDDGISSALFQFVSTGADATVSAAELKLIGVVDGQASLTNSDFGVY